MTLGAAIVLLALALAGIAACHIGLREKKTLRRVAVVLLSVLALALLGYIILTLLFVGAVSHQPPG